MNEVLSQLHARKSVRAFLDRPISPEARRAILEAACAAPTAGNQQLYTILDITDQAVKDTLADTCDHQPFIAQAPLVLLFCADCQKWYDAFAAGGCSPRRPGPFALLSARHPMFDTLFCNARIVDGTGTPWFWGSLGVQDGFVAAVLPRTTKPLSRHTIVLEGGILCPGFVDGHSHSERPLLSGEPTDCKTMQGVATENLGLDGMSPAPMRPIPIFWGSTRAN